MMNKIGFLSEEERSMNIIRFCLNMNRLLLGICGTGLVVFSSVGILASAAERMRERQSAASE